MDKLFEVRIIGMCPNCISQGTWIWIGPILICVAFAAYAGYFFFKGKQSGEFSGDEEEAKFSVFDD